MAWAASPVRPSMLLTTVQASARVRPLLGRKVPSGKPLIQPWEAAAWIWLAAQ